MPFRRPAPACCLLVALSLLVAFSSVPVHAAEVLWVGETSATLAWDPPMEGIIEGYVVFVSRNGGAEVGEQFVTVPRATVDGDVGEQLSVRVMSVGRSTPGGPQLVSDPSLRSEVIHFIERVPPAYADGLMLLHCAPCNKVRVLPMDDLTQHFDRFAPDHPWRLVGRGSARFPNDEQLWQHQDSGALLVLTLDPSVSVVAATSVPGMDQQEALQLAELDGDPEPEIITFFEGGPSLVFWERKGFDIVPFGYVTIPPGWNLVAAEDVDDDGKAELWIESDDPDSVDVFSWAPGMLDWRGRLASGTHGDVAAVADFDGDGAPDLLWRDSTGQLTVSYVDVVDGEVHHARDLFVPRLEGDDKLEVKGVGDLLARPGMEIVVQNTETFGVGAIVPLTSGFDVRVPLLQPDRYFELVRSD